MKAEQLKGHLDMLLLAVVAEQPAHGYEVIEALRGRSGGAFGLPEGTVYPALHRLEDSGLLASDWTEANGRRRRVYRLSSVGREALQARTADWERFAAAVHSVLEGDGAAKARAAGAASRAPGRPYSALSTRSSALPKGEPWPANG